MYGVKRGSGQSQKRVLNVVDPTNLCAQNTCL
jgi:hypothetical protein